MARWACLSRLMNDVLLVTGGVGLISCLVEVCGYCNAGNLVAESVFPRWNVLCHVGLFDPVCCSNRISTAACRVVLCFAVPFVSP